jgi:hypothetical protein
MLAASSGLENVLTALICCQQLANVLQVTTTDVVSQAAAAAAFLCALSLLTLH